MSAQHLAQLALEVWRASGPRTRERLEALVLTYAETYYGASVGWPEAVRHHVALAREAAIARM
jgi:hypothetical protein